MGVKLEHLFHENSELFQRILNSIAEGVIVANKDGEFLFFNSIANELLGIGLQKINPEKWSDVYGCYYPDRVTPFPSELLPLARTISTGRISRETVFIRNPVKTDGLFIDITGSPIIDTNHSILGGIVIFKDITESKLAEISIRQSEERLKAQFKGFPIPTYVWQKKKPGYILIDYNDAAESFTDGQIKELRGILLENMYPESGSEIVLDFLKCEKLRSSLRRDMDYTLRTSGETKQLQVYYVFIPPDLVVVHTEDVTYRRATERHLQKLSKAVEQTADGVVITDRDGKIEYVNTAFESISGYTRADAIGNTPRLLKSGEHSSQFYSSLWENLFAGNPYKGEMINRRKDGELFWVQNTISPVKDEKNEITNFVSVIKDITELKAKKEQEIRLQIAQEIQQRLFSENVHTDGFDIAGKNYPADETGGDYFDIITNPNGSFWLVIADVSDHGIGPALIMAETRAYLRAFLNVSQDAGEILAKLNNVLFADLSEFQFETMLLVHLIPGTNCIAYCGAGHVPGYLLRKNGTISAVLKSTGIPLGYRANEQYETCKISGMAPGDTLLLLTDGILEAMDGEENEFGFDRTLKLLAKHYQEKSAAIIAHIYDEISIFTGSVKPTDDITALLCKRDVI